MLNANETDVLDNTAVLPFVPGSYVTKGSKVIGRTGKQARLRQIAKEDKVSSAPRGEIRRGKGTIIRVPQGYQLVHKRGYEARKGFGYKYSNLNGAKLYKL